MMRNKIKFALLIILAFVLTACGTSTDSSTGSEDAGQNDDIENNEEQSAERKMLELTYEVADYDAENNAIHVSIETNLPEETEIYRAILIDEEGKNSLIKYEITLDEENEIIFPLEGLDKNALTDKEYQLVFEFNVTEKTNSNLFTDERLGGSFAEMDEAYQDSDHVSLTELGDAYSISLLSTNLQSIAEDYFPEEPVNE